MEENLKNYKITLMKTLVIMVFGTVLFGCDTDIKDEFDIRLNGKWISYITFTMSTPINNLPSHIIDLINQFPDINEFPDFYVNRETGMVEYEVEYKMELECNNGLFEYKNSSKGTCITNNGKLTMKTTHIYALSYPYFSDGDAISPVLKWYQKNEFIPKSVFSSGDGEYEIEYFSDEEKNNMFSERKYEYIISGNTLTFNFNGEIIIYNRE
jgi:hypothetical protein